MSQDAEYKWITQLCPRAGQTYAGGSSKGLQGLCRVNLVD